MRLQNYINERTFIVDDMEYWPSPEKMVKILKTKCSKFLKESTFFLFRGINDEVQIDEGGYDIRTPRTDRTPLNTSRKVHKALDQYFFNKFGWKPRSNGIFVTRSQNDAEDYGYSHIFFPVGNYEYVFSKYVTDLFQKSTILRKFLEEVRWNHIGNDDPLPIKFMEEMEALKYQNKSLRAVGLKEVMFKCDSYIMVHHAYVPYINEALKWKIPNSYSVWNEIEKATKIKWGDT